MESDKVLNDKILLPFPTLTKQQQQQQQKNTSVAQFLHRASEQNKWLCAVGDLLT